MKRAHPRAAPREFDFALVVEGVAELSQEVTDRLFDVGCDDATASMQYGLLYLEFSRAAPTLKEAILSAIGDVMKSGLPVRVAQVDDCNLVSAAEIARRIGRSRQLVHQYMKGERGPGGFPPPVCRITDRAPLWTWCAVSFWLAQHGIIRPEESENAVTVEIINHVLEERQHPELVKEITRELAKVGA